MHHSTLQSPFQTTLQYPVTCTGVALHSGANVAMTLHPAPADHGIVFVRSDVSPDMARVPARYDTVCDTQLGTTISNAQGTKVMTIEHLMAALWGCGVDNLLVELDGPEVPVMDGSSEPFVFLIECAGVETLDVSRKRLEILRTVAVEEDGATAIIRPDDALSLDITIQFAHEKIQTQHAVYDFSHTQFKQALCRARTFGFAKDVEALRQMGLARGGSLQNAIVLDETDILNADGLRYEDEFVRHKALDCVGDYFLAGHLCGAVTTVRPGHRINNVLMRAIMADSANYRLVEFTDAALALTWQQPARMAVATL